MKVCAKIYLKVILVTIVCVLNLPCHQCFGQGDNDVSLIPAVYNRAVIPLTPGSSTTLQNMPGEPVTFITVLALGQGTLKATLTKKDTHNDVLSMLIVGYPAEPAIVPSLGITPADIVVSTDIGDSMGGFGIIFIITTVRSTISYFSSLSIKLE